MKVVMGSDHAGFALKMEIAELVRQLGHTVTDVGTYDTKPADYPDYAAKVGFAVAEGQADRGIMICGSGVGATVACNKIVGVRAGTCHDTYSAHQGVEHDDMNVLVMGERIIGPMLAREIVAAFLKAVFSREERHVRRLNKVKALESGARKSA